MAKKHSGFTLIELMVAIGIFGILVAIVTPNAISWLKNSQFNSSVRQVKQSIEAARMFAVKSNSEAIVRFDGGNTFETEKQKRGTGEPSVTTTHRLPPEITVSSLTFTDDELTYNGRGMANAGALEVESNSGLCQRIVVTLVGSVRIEACP